MEAQQRIEMNVFCIESNPNHQLDYFDIKESSDEIQKSRDALEKSIKAMRAFKRGEEILKLQLRWEYEKYKKTVKQGHKLSKQYLKQCKERTVR